MAPRAGRAGGLRLHWKVGPDYVPVFPQIFRDENLFYSRCSFDVFKTHYIEKRYGPRPLMKLEHMGCYELLYFQSEMGERFHTTEMADRLGISRKTLSGYFDTLENLQLIQRIRNGRSFHRTIHIVMRAPLEPAQVDVAGYKLYNNVHKGFVQKQRAKVGASRWPTTEWDYPTIVKMLSDRETPRQLEQIGKGFKFAQRIMCEPGSRYHEWSEKDFRDHFEGLVKGECQRQGWAFTPRLFDTKMAIEMLGETVH